MAGASAQELLLIARQIGLPAGADSQEQVGARADQSSALCKQRGTKSFLTALASHHALAVTLRDMEAQSTSTSTTDIQELQALQKQLHVAVLNNQQVAQDHLSILNRVRTLRSKPSLPVETEHQAAFSQLLATIFSDLPKLASAHGDLDWAAQVQEDGTAWEARLRPMGQLVASCSGIVQALQRGQAAAEELAAGQAARLQA